MLLRTYMKRIMGLSPYQVQIVFGLAARIVMTLVVIVVSWCMEIDIMWDIHMYRHRVCTEDGYGVWAKMGKSRGEVVYGPEAELLLL